MLRHLSNRGLLKHLSGGGLRSLTPAPQIQRAFSSEAEDIQPPVRLFSVPGKYASALFVSAAKAKELDAVESEMHEVSKLVKTSPIFAEFLKDPSVPKDTRLKAVQDIFAAAKFSDISKNFLAVLAENGRLSMLPKIASLYDELVVSFKGIVKAKVTAALELSPAELAEVKDALKGYVHEGQTLTVEQTVDRSIIGGLVIEIGDKYIDLSIKSRIKEVEKLLEASL
eukprot:TRINITY_DN890_c0_g1_i1.p1 TRINITY_DN890_c0_g1~~TRINITY_DN890_c0_g1_i1.p1  ORF type:complete len:226 (+),score=61.23 TRINITY_DN890_c0_g1_i1:129-806(+)